MFGIPIWAIQLLIAILRQFGVITWADKLALKAGAVIVKDIRELKTYDEYPKGKNGL